ncbi:MAG: cytochrome-c oxidase, cbb3-type subunit II [Chromatiales bacterium]|jgi:cytochrome c oxidase cbb3-type subunit 2|nr:MAG: cytochrome-c oxidase, cbb3-type subunit II [Chromatiales bacterium]
MKHDLIEKNLGLLGILVAIVISVAGFVEIVPLYFATETTTPAPGVVPYTALEVEGRDIYIREGCYNCHSQMVRPLRSETERYGHYSVAGESVYDHPFQFGSKRTGPDLARVGGRYTNSWHRIHLNNPRDVVPESNMPGFPWLDEEVLDAELTPRKLKALRMVGVPYTDDEIATASEAVAGKTEMEALITYLQMLGRASRTWETP